MGMPKGIRVTNGAPWFRSEQIARMRVTCASFEPGFAIPSHFHDYGCLSVVVEGGFYQTFPTVEYECPPGGVIVKPPAERHIDRWGSVRSRHLIIEPSEVGQGEDPAGRVFEEVGFVIDPRATWLSRRIYEEFEEGDDLSRLAVEAQALELVVLAGRARRRHRRTRSLPDWLRRSRECLADGNPRTTSIAGVAGQVGVHPSRLARDFRRYFGLSPGDYVRQLRLARARSDLDRSRDPLSVIALRNGYADQSHLTREFRKATGLTPGAYRRVRRGNR